MAWKIRSEKFWPCNIQQVQTSTAYYSKHRPQGLPANLKAMLAEEASASVVILSCHAINSHENN